ncbi:MAG: zinc-ribbon domain-containing protein, partial [Acetobacteraceae bacterium]|nr:zinc-ribbon domain-containing protein [Acetobacteraceae bacterium]
MRVTCPACTAAYEVPDARIGAGRKLRCGRCGHDWWAHPAPPAGEGPFARAVV